jgi:hypothetical protein
MRIVQDSHYELSISQVITPHAERPTNTNRTKKITEEGHLQLFISHIRLHDAFISTFTLRRYASVEENII